MSTLGGAANKAVRLTFSAGGVPRAAVTLTGGALPAVGSAQTLAILDLTIPMTVIRSGYNLPGIPPEGDLPQAVLEGGAGGWDRLIPSPQSWQSDAGVGLYTILAAMALGSGETLVLPPNLTVGNYYEIVTTRAGQPVRYRDEMDRLVAYGLIQQWHVDPDGMTRFGPIASPTSIVTATSPQYALLRKDSAAGATVYGANAIAPFLPGNSVNGLAVTRVVVDETPDRFEILVWDTKSAPTFREAVGRVVTPLLPEFARTYVVAAVHAATRSGAAPNAVRVDLVAPPDAPQLPEIKLCEVWTHGGAIASPALRTLAAVVFLDSRHTRPVCVGLGPGVPTASTVDASGTVSIGPSAAHVNVAAGLFGAAREIDPVVNLGLYSGMLYYAERNSDAWTAVPTLANDPTMPGFTTPATNAGVEIVIAGPCSQKVVVG
jgi:hypothetical protein